MTGFSVNCIFASKTDLHRSSLLVAGTLSLNKVRCPITKLGLTNDTYWVSIGLKSSSMYLNSGKSSLTVYDQVNITRCDTLFINNRSPIAELTIYGSYGGLL